MWKSETMAIEILYRGGHVLPIVLEPLDPFEPGGGGKKGFLQVVNVSEPSTNKLTFEGVVNHHDNVMYQGKKYDMLYLIDLVVDGQKQKMTIPQTRALLFEHPEKEVTFNGYDSESNDLHIFKFKNQHLRYDDKSASIPIKKINALHVSSKDTVQNRYDVCEIEVNSKTIQIQPSIINPLKGEISRISPVYLVLRVLLSGELITDKQVNFTESA